jgi:hypothetical protein
LDHLGLLFVSDFGLGACGFCVGAKPENMKTYSKGES